MKNIHFYQHSHFECHAFIIKNNRCHFKSMYSHIYVLLYVLKHMNIYINHIENRYTEPLLSLIELRTWQCSVGLPRKEKNKKNCHKNKTKKKYQRKFPLRVFLPYTCELIYIMEMGKCLVYF